MHVKPYFEDAKKEQKAKPEFLIAETVFRDMKPLILLETTEVSE
jgi:hypothetical protein